MANFRNFGRSNVRSARDVEANKAENMECYAENEQRINDVFETLLLVDFVDKAVEAGFEFSQGVDTSDAGDIYFKFVMTDSETGFEAARVEYASIVRGQLKTCIVNLTAANANRKLFSVPGGQKTLGAYLKEQAYSTIVEQRLGLFVKKRTHDNVPVDKEAALERAKSFFNK